MKKVFYLPGTGLPMAGHRAIDETHHLAWQAVL